MTTPTPAQADEKARNWRYSINYGPDGEQNYANVYAADGQFVGNLRTHHAIAICNAFAVCEKLTALRPEGEAVAWQYRSVRWHDGKPGPWTFTGEPELWGNDARYEVRPLFTSPPAPAGVKEDPWQPMDSAPRDGRWFAVRDTTEYDVIGESPWWIGTARFERPQDGEPEMMLANGYDKGPIYPTHWAPLSSLLPPSTEAQAGSTPAAQGTVAALGPIPIIETFAINPVGEGDIVVEGGSRFAHERDVAKVLEWARSAEKLLGLLPVLWTVG